MNTVPAVAHRIVPALLKSFRISRFGAAVAAAAATLALAWGAVPAQAQELKVGVVLFLSGPAAGPFGIPAQNGTKLVVDALNAGTLPAPYNTKGIAGMTISPVYIDEAGGTAKQVEEYRNLVQRQGVNVVVGYISSGDCLAVAPVAEEMKTLTLLADCGTPRIFEDGTYHYVFRTRPHGTMDNVAAARYLIDQLPDLKRYSGINQNYAWGQDSWRDFHAAMTALKPNAEVATEQFPKLFAGQFSSEISALLLSRSDVVHSSLWGGDLESFVFQATARGLDKRSLIVFTAGEPYMFRLKKSLPDGVVLGARGPYGLFAHDTELNRWFRAEYIKRFDEPPVYASYGYGHAFLALKKGYEDAMKANGGKVPNQEQVIKAIEGMTYEGFGSTAVFNLGNGHQATTEAAIGRFKYDKAKDEATLTDVKYYPSKCVNPPDGMSSVDWIEGGMKGAQCN